jgi:hypothetical protein
MLLLGGVTYWPPLAVPARARQVLPPW